MIKHLEVKTYEFYNIRVMVEINYDLKQISLVEKTSNCNYNDFSTKLKAYVFVRRGLEYMNGWRNVLSAINYAIDEAQKELEEYLKQIKNYKDGKAVEGESVIIDKSNTEDSRELSTLFKGMTCFIHPSPYTSLGFKSA